MQDRRQRRVASDRLGNRLEPALDAAIERVVVPALVVRLMRLSRNPGWRGAKDSEPASPIAPALGHLGIDPKIVPTVGKAFPIGEAGLLQQPPHFRRAREGEAVTVDYVSERSEQFCHWGLPGD